MASFAFNTTSMRYYPVFLDLSGSNCLVIGGGSVAERKVLSLMKTGCFVTVWSPHITEKLTALAKEGRIKHRGTSYRRGFLNKYRLVIAATDNPKVQRAIAEEAGREGVLVNVVDRPELCNFIVPAIVNRGPLTLAVSTGGASPAMAKRIRGQLEAAFGDEYGLALEILSRIREKLPSTVQAPGERQRLFNRIVNAPLVERLQEKRFDDVDCLLTETFGERFTMKQLGIRVEE